MKWLINWYFSKLSKSCGDDWVSAVLVSFLVAVVLGFIAATLSIAIIEMG